MIARWFLCVVLVVLTVNGKADYADRKDVNLLIDEMVSEHNFTRAELELVFADAQHNASIIKAISRPAERTKQWYEYRNIFLDQKRIDNGVAFWDKHADVLEKAQQMYSVPPEIMVAIIGVETRYGKRAGSYKVLDALSTLGFDYPPRQKFFRNELKEFLLLSREENRKPHSAVGSYAGAMGFGQFMPSSYRAYAVDFDGDGLRDIWNNPVDAIGSVGNYLKRHGWTAGEDIVSRVGSADDSAFAALANTSLKPSMTVSQWQSKGRLESDVEAATEVALFRMQNTDAVEYWMGMRNFYVVTRYNHSSMYALAVVQLSREIARSRATLATTE
jgi:membrane-bound lytic murein transglycosylase B